ncbi:type I DNA topoisomerase [Pajaroellobacter abortibovis]|uniref:DNA topoisomerase 1 n=1 Tax=Pajaroellobacter abortibovis TaxID=1882918 RepID=A0A1L6MWL3_9BACT|nr:type I DNA topoisomerase [Pajaroellobacter abortibovis]APR99807.1 DNA topoisomerase I [Pajaroellobacter abortibovis]
MQKTLIVVESPTKAKTIKRYLGSQFEVIASKGHIKDLPKKMGIDIENNFQETYELIKGKEKFIDELKAAAKKAQLVLLATDPDREGEAIAWHIAEELRSLKNKPKRVEFHEVTQKGINQGVNHPRALNKHLYEAQRARRIVDRIVGYDVSSLVWSKLAFGLSAGRVQSVTLRLIVDREREIDSFVPVEYWNCAAALAPQEIDTPPKKGETSPQKPFVFIARLHTKNGERFSVSKEETALTVRDALEKASYQVSKVTKSERKRRPPPPYTTSKLQQDAVNRLGFAAKRTMQIAQALYEGIELDPKAGTTGLITYMRTDSTRIAPEAIEEARTWIVQHYGPPFIPPTPPLFKTKKGVQDAHEAIRPTSLEFPPEAIRKYLKEEQYKLYKLIWDRFLASQMKEASDHQTTVEITAIPPQKGGDQYGLRATGRILKFAGWLEIYRQGEKEPVDPKLAGEEEMQEEEKKDPLELQSSSENNSNTPLPPLKEREALTLITPPGVLTEQKFTQPPPRYTEASLVRELEERGIGRPSTYAEIISKVQARDYVEKIEGGRFQPKALGKFVVDGLIRSKLDFMDPSFTSHMEEELDAIESGALERTSLLKRFYERFRMQLEEGKKEKRWNPEPQPTGKLCEVCGKGEMLKRWAKNGWFLGCSQYPACKHTRNLGPDGNEIMTPTLAQHNDIACDQCGKPMMIRAGRFGEFMSCTGYPQCKSTRAIPLGVQCPECGGKLIEVKPKKKGGRTFYGCSQYNHETTKCTFKIWQKPIPEACPQCQTPLLIQGGTKTKPSIMCIHKSCGYKRAPEPAS